MIQFVALILCVTTALAVISLCSGLIDLFALRRRFDLWMLLRAERADLIRYLPYMSETEREIIGYLLAKNERVFTADSDAGHAATLLGKRYIRVAIKGRQEVFDHSVPMEVPEHLWKLLEANRSMFPVIDPDKYPAPPWRVPWMARWKRVDEGLGAAGLIVLAAILAFLVGLGGEAWQRGLYDFLKDFQGAIVGGAAFAIAVWAARPVYEQLSEVKRQTALQTHELFRTMIAHRAAELQIVQDLRVAAAQSVLFEKEVAEQTVLSGIFTAGMTEVLKRRYTELDAHIVRFQAARVHVWGTAETNQLQHNVYSRALSLKSGLSSVIAKFSRFNNAFSRDAETTWESVTVEARQLSLRDQSSNLTADTEAYSKLVLGELTRLRSQAEAQMSSIA